MRPRLLPPVVIPVLLILLATAQPIHAQLEDGTIAAERLAEVANVVLPDGVGGQAYAGALLFLSGYPDQAEETLTSVIRAHSGHPLAIYALARLFMDTDRINAAEKRLQPLLSREAPFVPAIMDQARIHILKNQLRQAEEVLLKAQSAEPDNTDVILLLGQVYAMRGDAPARAIRSLRSAYKDNADDAELNLELGTLYFQQGEFESARYFFEKAVELGRTGPLVRMELARTYYNIEMADEAIALLKGLLKEHPEPARVNYYLGLSYLKKELWPQGHRYVRTGWRQDKTNASALYYMAFAKWKQGLAQQALFDAVRFRAAAWEHGRVDPAIYTDSLRLIEVLEQQLGVERLPGQEIGSMEGMVSFPARELNIGSDEPLEVAPFAIGVREVTMAEYAVFIDAVGWRAPAGPGGGEARNSLVWNSEGEPPAGSEALPVVFISWRDALAYAAWCGKRLPTEAEWSIAAEDAAERSLHSGTDGPGPATEGPLTKSGLRNMLGNVAEWCLNGYSESLVRSLVPGKERLRQRAYRGGHWASRSEETTTAYRAGLRPGARSPYIGFRLATTLEEEK